ncbi:MAG TPA: hypothetical protein VH420_08675 [Gaiellaceae bacterium]|jgi:hypothetical protein
MTLGRFTLLAVLAAALVAIAVPTAGAHNPQSTATLTGEEMLVQDVTITTLDCDPSRVSRVGYTATGVATGPYPGPFTVHGTVKIQPQTLPGPRPGTTAGTLLSLFETFTIDSPAGDVIGVKTLPLTGPTDSDMGTCLHVTGFATGPITDATGTVIDIFSEPVYAASIYTPWGATVDVGDALLSFSELNLDGTCGLDDQCHYRLAGFDQFFLGSVN